MSEPPDPMPDMPPEQWAHMAGAAMRLVSDWLEAVFDHDDLASAWTNVEEPLRLALVQSWVIDGDGPVADLDERDRLAGELASPQPSHPSWISFAQWRVERWRSVLPSFVVDAADRGFVSTPALMGVDLEAVLVAEAVPGESRAIEPRGSLQVQRFLIRHTPEGPALPASVGFCRYLAGHRQRPTASRTDHDRTTPTDYRPSTATRGTT